MPNYRLTVSYDGTDYAGWQIQPHAPSIEQTLRKSFARIFKKDLWLLGASRTDAGVHAQGQVVLCKTSLKIDPKSLAHAWNRSLPPSTTILSCIEVDDDFHPHFNVVQKTYRYVIFTSRPTPFVARYGWYCPKELNFSTLKTTLKNFIGTYDFRSFSAAQECEKDTKRKIDSIEVTWSSQINGYQIEVKGKRFMRHMIRRIVGAAVWAATHGPQSMRHVKQVLLQCDANNTLPTAPACGLTLCNIEYQEEQKS